MVRNKHKLNEFYRKLDAEEKLSYKEALRIYDALHKEAVALGAISHENIWDGFEVDLRIAKAINSLPSCADARQKETKGA
jgi:DNA-binding transcriptional regulator/RsmH inhibitor MraZ